ncbi:hypothetical protein SAMN02745196_01056 [Clostridium collagenovorans DSM 3089]|uniref:Uncharacterized protein n=1 Tax=Clostridium collagenovorans DSM 3089 TaxID=1121306 RepID=A0A1M5V1W6_9CLOT|nr:hypothetical protein SAMN02745196_01056 [Clostridium collagenovorans DSM 3089]
MSIKKSILLLILSMVLFLGIPYAYILGTYYLESNSKYYIPLMGVNFIFTPINLFIPLGTNFIFSQIFNFIF